jgi:predicted regulator of Ras-like GTPase activity (Roadblock/LC7/MglB family)
MTGASSVWNAMLGMWNRVKSQPGWDPNAVSPMLGSDFPIKVHDIGETTTTGAPRPHEAPAVVRVSRPLLEPSRAREALAPMLRLDGLLGCAVVDGGTGLVVARELREDHPVEIELAAAAAAQMLRTHRQAARNTGLNEPIEEIISTAGPRHLILRVLPRHGELFLMALLDKHRTNLALARFQLIEVERALT